MPDETLSLLLTDIRSKTLRLLDGVDETLACFAPPGLQNTILWHAGHSFVVVETLGVSNATGQPPVYPPGYFDAFSWKSTPAIVTTWPALSEVVGHLRDQQTRLAAMIQSLSAEQLSKPAGDPTKNRTVRWFILHGLHDEANHQGEIHLLKKLYAKRA